MLRSEQFVPLQGFWNTKIANISTQTENWRKRMANKKMRPAKAHLFGWPQFCQFFVYAEIFAIFWFQGFTSRLLCLCSRALCWVWNAFWCGSKWFRSVSNVVFEVLNRLRLHIKWLWMGIKWFWSTEEIRFVADRTVFEPDHTGLDMVQKGFDRYQSRCDIILLRYAV